MVKNIWKTCAPHLGQSAFAAFAYKILTLKHNSIDWVEGKRIKDENILRDTELELVHLGDEKSRGFDTP